jgi:hypothetical protein
MEEKDGFHQENKMEKKDGFRQENKMDFARRKRWLSEKPALPSPELHRGRLSL